MDEIKRLLLVEVIEGNRNYVYLAYHVSKHVRGEDICCWLLRNRITGDRLWAWFKKDFDGSVLKLISFVVSKIEKAEMRQIIGGKDYI